MVIAARDVPSFSSSRSIFLRLLGVVYLIAFASLAVQVTGLVGENGLLPVGAFLTQAHEVYGSTAYRLFPTLAWLSPTGAFLTVLCWTGVALSILLLLGIVPMLTTTLLWVLYLSLTIAGQEFLQFQWDALLLETGLLAVLYAPLAWRSRLRGDADPPAAVRWVLWGLAFKVTFLSGVTKILSGDPTWANLMALSYHYQTQPLPAPTSWYVHQLPAPVHIWSAATMFIIELGVPWMAFAPARFRRVRQVGCVLMAALQVGIAATGNYGFFNLLTIVLYLALLDDRTFEGIFGRARRGGFSPRWDPAHNEHARRAGSAGAREVIGGGPARLRTVVNIIAIVIAVLSVMTLFREMDVTWGRPTLLTYLWSPRLLNWVAPLDSVNGYGLFRVMTTERPEIVVDVSDDGMTWKEYPFRWKPGEVRRRPAFVQPHMPRLDWQMWFAALGPESAREWLSRLVERLSADDADVTRLLGPNPLGHPPRYARLSYYQYRFTTRAERTQTGAWWRREFVGYLTNTISVQVR
jgi:lipase maturation factor 1